MLELIQQRLAAMAPSLTEVIIAEDIDAMGEEAGRVESGTVIVTPFRERAEPSPLMTGGHRQRVEVQFLIGLVIRNHEGDFGAARAQAFDAPKASIEAALAGWEPDGFDPISLVGGESSPIGDGVSIYVQTWETARFLTGA